MCVCVRERESERESVRVCVCVCVDECVCVVFCDIVQTKKLLRRGHPGLWEMEKWTFYHYSLTFQTVWFLIKLY